MHSATAEDSPSSYYGMIAAHDSRIPARILSVAFSLIVVINFLNRSVFKSI